MITLKTLEAATAQEVFDQVAAHLLIQGRQSINGDMCLYRGPDGLKCAAGCLISDDEYIEDMEHCAWSEIDSPIRHASLISNLQNLHDNVQVEDWPEQLREVAIAYDLSPWLVDAYEAKDAPSEEDFGYHQREGFDDIEGGWLIEGGEEKWNLAVKVWEAWQEKRKQ